jgi:hypothetical protein
MHGLNTLDFASLFVCVCQKGSEKGFDQMIS